MIVAARLGLVDDPDDLIVVVCDGEDIEIDLADSLVLFEHYGACERHERVPERAAVEDDGDGLELAGLEERDDLKELVERAEAAGEVYKNLGRVRERDLAGKEEVEGYRVRGVRIVMLLHRKADRGADGFASGLERAAVAGLHDAGPAARDHCVVLALLCDAARENARLVIELVALTESRGSVECHGLCVRFHFAHALFQFLVDAADAHAGRVGPADLDAALLYVLRGQVAVGNVVLYLYCGVCILVVHRHISYHNRQVSNRPKTAQ